ncbi:hypothetical protein [Streptomyces sp. NPDC060187]|uniref:hypothetical protein n=1 Tax=Streptomyces sp. NPDC060187 TaxID=3347067 RepID=UPI003651355F
MDASVVGLVGTAIGALGAMAGGWVSVLGQGRQQQEQLPVDREHQRDAARRDAYGACIASTKLLSNAWWRIADLASAPSERYLVAELAWLVSAASVLGCSLGAGAGAGAGVRRRAKAAAVVATKARRSGGRVGVVWVSSQPHRMAPDAEPIQAKAAVFADAPSTAITSTGTSRHLMHGLLITSAAMPSRTWGTGPWP